MSTLVLKLVLKLVLAPAFVLGASMVGRRFGPRVGGLVGGLPVVGGPILLVITLEHGRRFGADSATGTLVGLLALATFVLVYGHASLRLRPAPTLLLGWAGFLAVDVVLSRVTFGPLAALGIAWVTFAGITVLMPATPAHGGVAEALPPWDLPVRAVGAMAMVAAVTTASGALGPQWSGLLAPFPVIASVLAVFTHAHLGLRDTNLLLRGLLSAYYAFALFAFVLAVRLPRTSTAVAFGSALAASLSLQLVIGVLGGRGAPAEAALTRPTG